MSTELTCSLKENMARFSFYRAGKVSEGNLVLTELTWQTKDFSRFTALTEFYWLTQDIIFWNSVYRAGLASEGIFYFVI